MSDSKPQIIRLGICSYVLWFLVIAGFEMIGPYWSWPVTIMRAGIISSIAGTISMVALYFAKTNISLAQFIRLFISIYLTIFFFGGLLAVGIGIALNPTEATKLKNYSTVVEGFIYSGYWISLLGTMLIMPVSILRLSKSTD